MLRLVVAVVYALSFFLLPASANAQFENVSMGTRLSVENNSLVVRWSTTWFDHYNIRWSANGGPDAQFERDGDKNFRYITPFVPGAVYRVAVQGCVKPLIGRSTCTSWDGVGCGEPRYPCDGPTPTTIKAENGLCLEVVPTEQHSNGGRVRVWECNNTDHQLWSVRDGHIVSLAGKCLDLNAADLRKDGGRVQVWDCNGSRQQRWAFRDQQRLQNGGGKCLYVARIVALGKYRPRPSQNGAPVRTWACGETNLQRWIESKQY